MSSEDAICCASNSNHFFPGNDIAFVESMHQNLLEGAVPKAELSSQIDDMLDSIDAYLSAKDEG